MRLFGRKRSEDEIEERCPYCGEPVPEGAVDCMMCGAALMPFQAAARSPKDEPPSGGSSGSSPLSPS
jgi:zinc ribbon protein